MKKFKIQPYFIALLILLLTVACIAVGFGTAKTASADTARADRPRYYTYLSGYAVEMDIKSDRSIAVTEDITVYFYDKSGFIRDIPVNAGEVIKNVKVSELINGSPTSVYYDVDVEDSGFLSIDIGDFSTKNDEHTYRITYDYCLTKAQEGANKLALTPIGAGWECEIENASLTLKLPDGYISNSAAVFIQPEYVSDTETLPTLPVEAEVKDGRTVIKTIEPISLNGSTEALRVNLEFEEGALSTYFDFTPYWFVIAAGVILVLLVIVKFLFFNKGGLTPYVNFDAPNKMSPLLMGKLIDGKIDSEDITSMIFYWADKGYLKINFDDQRDPSLIRIVKALPQGTPDYEQILFAELFNGLDAIKPSFLRNRFYITIDKVSRMVDGQNKNLYDKKSVIASWLFAILAGLMLGLAPFLLGMFQISLRFTMWQPFVAMIPLLLVFVFATVLANNKFKSKKSAKIIIACLAGIISAFLTLFYTLFVPSFIIGIIPKILLCVITCVTVGTSVILINRTKTYTEQLNEIVGFKNFIELVEKEKLETLLEEDPEFFYHILPYAQVLGVSDKWEEKFRDITVQPPQWATSSTADTLLNFYLMNRIMRISFATMKANMASRPNSSGSSGGGHGSFGGFSGGGHGGGGGRFR